MSEIEKYNDCLKKHTKENKHFSEKFISSEILRLLPKGYDICYKYVSTPEYIGVHFYLELIGKTDNPDNPDLIGYIHCYFKNTSQNWIEKSIASFFNKECHIPELFVNDSGYDFDPSCYATGETCGGRLVMNFAPTCVPEFEARQIVAEFVNLDDLCEASGDANGDGTTNVVDIVRIVDHILGGDQLGGYLGCEADINGDDIINVVDVVAIVGQILGRTVENDATEATIQLDNNQISIKADGYVAGVDLVVEFTGDLNIEFADNYIADYSIDGNTAHIILVSTENVEDVLTVKSGRIVSILEATVVNSNDALPMDNVSIEEPATFVVGEAFPNPFNPSTNISVELTATADLSVKVYNLMGQLVDVIAEGSYSPSTYNWTWNAENLASGVYLVKTQVGSDVSTQKVMLLK